MERPKSPDNDIYGKINSSKSIDTVLCPESSEKRGRRKERGRESSKERDSESISSEKRGRGKPKGSKNKKNNKEPERASARIKVLFIFALNNFKIFKKILDEREKARLEKIEEWKLSLPKSDKELLEITRNYSKRHEQPRSKISRLKGKVTSLCHKAIPDKFKYYCGAKDSRHQIPYYDSGDFTFVCNYCKAELLQSEKKAMEEHRWGKCCGYGTVDTELMRAEYKVIVILNLFI